MRGTLLHDVYGHKYTNTHTHTHTQYATTHLNTHIPTHIHTACRSCLLNCESTMPKNEEPVKRCHDRPFHPISYFRNICAYDLLKHFHTYTIYKCTGETSHKRESFGYAKLLLEQYPYLALSGIPYYFLGVHGGNTVHKCAQIKIYL